jgi:hypothetical protein
MTQAAWGASCGVARADPPYNADLMTEEPKLPRPAEFKTRSDGRGGLIKATLVGEPHDGRALYIDELDLPAEIWTTPGGMAFEWWPSGVRDVMERTAAGSDPTAPPVHYKLRIPEDSGEPLYVSDTKAR